MLADISVLRPPDLAEALQILASPPGGARPTVLAGGTDLMVLLNAGVLVPSSVLSIDRLDGLRGVRQLADGRLEIGALTTYRELIASPLAQAASPFLVEAARTVGATQIQARGTLGGNVANASPAGDTLPVLLAHGTEVLLASRDGGERTSRFDGFYAGYRQPDIRPDELIVALRLDVLPQDSVTWFRKVGTRLAQAISKVMIAGVATLDDDGRIDTLRLAAGSVAPTPIRLPTAEAAAIGGMPADVAAAAGEGARADVTPIDDVRSDAEYRREVTGRLVARFVGSLG